ncbi:integrase catalytic domain-containing protein [Caerostris darwini]|uniref:Integrase catalytic domain-containing protein n=1 Tax=Caerostris darwini TaxID=1538125 RepID=A0AAV4VAB9_9ARAC|nr:integrase catalytic domain-containing protein [Caerostris darwini]
MITLLCECESIVNGRPLTYIYDDPNELRATKPSDFIQDIKGTRRYCSRGLRQHKTVKLAIGEYYRIVSRIYPLELSSPEILNDVSVRVKDSSDTFQNDNQHTVLNEQSFEPKDLPKEQLETLKRSRFGRQIIPVQRLDL